MLMEKLDQEKWNLKRILTNDEKIALCVYIEEMANCRLPLIPIQVKLKVEQMT